MTDESTETATTESTETTTSTETAAATETAKDWEAETTKWKALARKHEEQSKSNADKAKAFDELEESQKTEVQKAIDAAAKAKQDADKASAELAIERAMRKHGLGDDDLELLGTHGTPAEIDARAEKLAARLKTATTTTTTRPDFGAGDRGGDVSGGEGQWTQADVKRASAEGRHADIEKARVGGLLTDVLAGKSS